MAGEEEEEASFKRCMEADETAAKEAVDAGEEGLLERCTSTTTKIKVEEAHSVKATAPAKKMKRLPKKEADWILAQVVEEDHRLRREVREQRRQNRHLHRYAAARDFIEIEDEFSVFQMWVRSKYDKHGYVEVDDDKFRASSIDDDDNDKFLADRAKVRASSDDEGVGEEARDKALFKDIDYFSGSNDDMKEFFMNLWP